MGLKSTLTPIARLRSLDEQQRRVLRQSSVTTAEELAGLLWTNPEHARSLLGMDDPSFAHLQRETQALLGDNPELAQEFNRQRGKRYPLGALEPSQ